MKDMTFKVEKDGVLKEYEIITYFKNPNTDKNYIVYNEPGNDEAYASVYRIEKGELILDEILTDEEWDYIDEVIESMGE